MRILLINNHTKHLDELEEILKPNKVITVPLDEIPEDYSGFDAIILSGGNRYPVKRNDEKFADEIKLIKNSSVPLLGICLGFELICYTYGEQLEKLENMEEGIKNIEILKKDKLFKGIEKLKAFEKHKWGVKEVNNLIPLAKSAAGMEAVKHPTKQIYGVQFHPEAISNASNGIKVLENFLEFCI
ncbi:MAG: gamma-glutamyl-gamma-aminobutyrate hydrolase family protein [Candidatus Aenigmarchaeota archaeon]|nr:gamma-glutamyl-gamma-aminobutyrate hydrolase family protein [Candidatus Aenigmarchaeota archaeon]